jgi:protein O-GlcNAc transferase
MTKMAIQQSFAEALRLHKSGRLQQAEEKYRQILVLRPNHGDAMHLLGTIALQSGQNQKAVDLISKSIKLIPQSPEAHGNLGVALQNLGRNDEAIASFKKALALKPDFAAGHLKLAEALVAAGRSEEAIAQNRKAIAIKPDYADAYASLGNTLQKNQQIDEAIEAYQRALAIKPNYPEALSNMGNALQTKENFDQAVACYRKAVELKPDYADAWANLGVALQTKGELDESILCSQKAVQIKPDYATAYNNLGNALKDRGRVDEAITNYHKSLELNPDYVEAHTNLGNAFQLREQYEEAIACYQKALKINPDFIGAHNNLGNTYAAMDRPDEAVVCYEAVLKLAPDRADAHGQLASALLNLGRPEEALAGFTNAVNLNSGYVDAYNNLANAAKDLGRLDDAIAHYRKTIELDPNYTHVHSNLVYTLHFHPGFDSQQILREHHAWDKVHIEPRKKFIQPHLNDRDPNRRLRIGYVSPDFRDHCQCFFTDPLLKNHDHRQFEIFCYASVEAPDAVTGRLRSYADEWRNGMGLSDEQLTELIRRDQIDILVDLTMHMAQHRLKVFARKPAPVQVTWLAYPSTTGVSTIDYRITDSYLDPPGMYDADYVEKSWQLPDTFWCYDLTVVGLGSEMSPKVSPLPAQENGFITFGCLNNFCKVSDSTLDLWAKVMEAVPHSKLILLAPEGSPRERVLNRLAAGGVRPDQVEFMKHVQRRGYLEVYQRMDIGLDTQPYNGHTTSLDAFWMGVPVVNLVGNTIVGRAGWSLLSNLNLRELATHTPEEYVKVVKDLANDLPRLAQLRANLRPAMQKSPLMNGPLFARNFETAYRSMWRTWCESPQT